MKRTSLWLSTEQIQKLKAASKRSGLKMAELVRRFIDEGLSKQK